jgi:Ca2+-binding EF-hand superfamily protein
MITSLSQSSSSAADYFSRIDTNADGKLTADELKTDFGSHIKKASTATEEETAAAANAPATPDFAKMVTDGDTDGDGALSEVEFTTAMQAKHAAGSMSPPPPPQSAEEEDSQTVEDAVSSLDTDGDSKLSADELLAAYKAKGTSSASGDSTGSSTSSDPDFASLISALDTDGDGKLNTDEITSLLTESRQNRPPPPPPVGQMYAANSTDSDTASSSTLIGQA